MEKMTETRMETAERDGDASRRRPFMLGCLTGLVLGSVGLVAAVVAGSYVFQDQMVAQKRARLKPPPVTLGVRADYSMVLQRLDGPDVAMESFRGKPVFLHFWSPDCVNCLPELEGLNRLFLETEALDLIFACVAVSGFDGLPDTARKEGLQFPVYYFKGELPELYAGGIPGTFIADREGSLALRHQGSAKWDDPSVAALLRFLAGPGE